LKFDGGHVRRGDQFAAARDAAPPTPELAPEEKGWSGYAWPKPLSEFVEPKSRRGKIRGISSKTVVLWRNPYRLAVSLRPDTHHIRFVNF